MRGADRSFLHQSKAAEARYADARGKVHPAEKLLRAQDTNCVEA
jgi:hypothetical protein